MSAQIVRLPSGREVVDTGRVLIGVRHGEQQPQRDIGSKAEAIQSALLSRPDPRSRVRYSPIPLPDPNDRATLRARADGDRAMRSLRPIRREPVLYLDNSMLARVMRWIFGSGR